MATVRTYRLPGFLAAFIIVTGTVGTLGLLRIDESRLRKLDIKAIADGRAGSAVQAAFDDAVLFRKAAVAAAAALRHSLFGEGFAGVLPGVDGWLFSSEEFERDLGYLDGAFDETVAHARDTLVKQGIRLVVAVVPSKTRVMQDKLGHIRIPEAVEDRYEAILVTLERLSVPAVDLLTALSSSGAAAEPFLRADSHWSPEGARSAADAVAGVVKALAPDLPSAGVRTETAGETVRDGDLMAFMPKLGTSTRPLPPPQAIPSYETTIDSGTGLFGSQVIPAALVGTSYSAEKAFHFEGFLKQALSADVLNLASVGKGPFVPMDQALEGTVLADSGVRVVVWEIPERYVPVN
jgi:alginate O-acetyltransferase complex protein AlgJ